MYEDNLVQKAYPETACSDLRMPNLRENLENQLKRSEAETKRLQELLSLLDQNPDTQRILELIGGRI